MEELNFVVLLHDVMGVSYGNAFHNVILLVLECLVCFILSCYP